MNEMQSRPVNIDSADYYSDNILPKGFWEWTLLLFIISSLTVSYIPGLTKLTVLYGIMLVGLFFIYFLHNRVSLELPPEVVAYFIWIIWSLGGLVNAADMTLYTAQMKTIIQMGIMIAFVAIITARRQKFALIMLALAIGGIIAGALSIYSGEYRDLSAEGRVRAEGITGNANAFGYFLLFVIVSVIYFLKRNLSLFWKIILSIVTLFSFVFIILSGSRKSFLGVFVFIFLWIIFCQLKNITKNPLRVTLILIILLGGTYFAVDYVISKTYLGHRLENMDDRSNQTRMQMYMEGLDMIKKYPLVGVGLDNYRVWSSSQLYSHSDYTEVAANTGIIGFVLYFSVYVILWLRLNRIKAMTNNPHLLYTVGLIKAIVITMLLIAFGRVNITSKLTWIFLAAVFGYTWSAEQTLRKRRVLDDSNKSR